MKTPIIYRKIAGLLEEMGYSRKSMADYLGVSYGTLHNKLCKITPITWDEVQKIADYLGWDKPISDLMKEYPRNNGRRKAETGAGAPAAPTDEQRAIQH